MSIHIGGSTYLTPLVAPHGPSRGIYIGKELL